MKRKLFIGIFTMATVLGVIAGFNVDQNHSNLYAERGIVSDSISNQA